MVLSLRILLLTVVSIASINGASIQSGRIIGGEIASISDFPWHVSLRRNGGQHSCGGALISTTKVLTAAHCVYGAEPGSINVVTGSESLARGGEFHDVSAIDVHENYIQGSEYSWRYDVAIITLSTPAEISETQSPIEIGDKEIPKNTPAVISGWGLFLYPTNSLPTNLQTFNLSILSNADCQRYHTLTVYNDHICAMTSYGEGVCSGDSGSALVVDGKVVGITSWVRPCAVGYPDVYTRVSSFYDWIVEHTDDDSV